MDGKFIIIVSFSAATVMSITFVVASWIAVYGVGEEYQGKQRHQNDLCVAYPNQVQLGQTAI